MFTPQGGGQVYRVPYAGFKGDYQSIQVLTPTANGFPWLARLDRSQAHFQVPPASERLHDDRPARRSRTSSCTSITRRAAWSSTCMRQAKKDKWVGTAITRDYLSRSSTATAFSDFPWDGTAKKGQGNSYGNAGPVADGTYYAVLTLTKALGTKKRTSKPGRLRTSSSTAP